MPFGDIYRAKRVLITGHTGFKGAWLSEWLLTLGAEVAGIALPPATNPSLFEELGLAGRMRHEIIDVRDRSKVERIVTELAPDFVFHLAAQSLVRESYRTPVDTFAVNVMGTIHVLEGLRALRTPCVAVMVTTDKCYANDDNDTPFTETDPLGGADPYSSSKAATELAIAAWRRSFFRDHPVRIASGRAGNVIGGGDWAADRIVPDCITALRERRKIVVRNPDSTRPWQHVLEPLSGYLQLAAAIHAESAKGNAARAEALSGAFNFGPGSAATRTVRELVEQILREWPGEWEHKVAELAPHEAVLLALSTTKARRELHWAPTWSFEESVRRTVRWYRTAVESGDVASLSRADIADYTATSAATGIRWAR